MSIVQKILDEKTATLELMKATTAEGRPFFAYFVIRRVDLKKLKEETGLRTLPKNAIVLHSDFGTDIPDGVEKRVMEEFKKLLKNYE